MLKEKSVLIFGCPIYSVQLHINKIISFRKGENQTTCCFPLPFSSQEIVYPTHRIDEERVSEVSTRQAAAAALQRSRWAGGEAALNKYQAQGEVLRRCGSTARAMRVPPDVSPALPGLWMSCAVPALLSPEQNVQCPCEAPLEGSLIWG